MKRTLMASILAFATVLTACGGATPHHFEAEPS